MSSDGQISVGIVGLGRSGWFLHAEPLAQHPRFRIAAVSDPVHERRQEAVDRFGCVAYADPAELGADSAVELVVIATPSHTHAPLALAALRAGKHVVVEKPMASTPGEVDQLAAAATAAGRVVTCFHNLRFARDFRVLREIIDSGRLGEVVMIRRCIHRFVRRADWQTMRKYGGGELSNTAPHLLDQVLQLLPDGPIEVAADLRRTVTAGDAEDHVKLTLRAATGPTIDVESSACVALPQPEWLVVGTTGGLVSTDDGLSMRWFDPAGLSELEVDEGPAPGRRYRSGSDDAITWKEDLIDVGDEVSISEHYYDSLAATLRDGAPLAVTPAAVRRQIEIIERVRNQTAIA